MKLSCTDYDATTCCYKKEVLFDMVPSDHCDTLATVLQNAAVSNKVNKPLALWITTVILQQKGDTKLCWWTMKNLPVQTAWFIFESEKRTDSFSSVSS